MTSDMENEVQTTNEAKTTASKNKEKGDIENRPNKGTAATGRLASAYILWLLFALILIVGALSACSLAWMFLYVRRENAMLRIEVGRAHMTIESIDTLYADIRSLKNKFTDQRWTIEDLGERFRAEIFAVKDDLRTQINDLAEIVDDVKTRGLSDSQIQDSISEIKYNYNVIDEKVEIMIAKIDKVETEYKYIEEVVGNFSSTLGGKVESLKELVAELRHEPETSSAATAATTLTSESTTELLYPDLPIDSSETSYEY